MAHSKTTNVGRLRRDWPRRFYSILDCSAFAPWRLCAIFSAIELEMPVLSQELRDRIVAALAKYPNKRAATLPALHIVHNAHRAVSPEAIVEIAEILELHPAEVHDTMSFYGFFRTPENPQSSGRESRVGVPKHFVHASRRRGVVGVAKPQVGR
jgi:hypothetical protein